MQLLWVKEKRKKERKKEKRKKEKEKRKKKKKKKEKKRKEKYIVIFLDYCGNSKSINKQTDTFLVSEKEKKKFFFFGAK